MNVSNHAILFPQISSPIESLMPREPKPIIYPANFEGILLSNNAFTFPKEEIEKKEENIVQLPTQFSQKDDIEFGFETQNHIEQEDLHGIDIQFEDSKEILEEILANNELALDGHIEFETQSNAQLNNDNDADEEPLILEFEDAMKLNQEENIEIETTESIEFEAISSIPEQEKTSNVLDIEYTDTQTDQKTSLFDDERYRAKILTAIKMRDLNFEPQKVADITGISIEEMQEFEQYLEKEALKALSKNAQTIEDKDDNNETDALQKEKTSLEPIDNIYENELTQEDMNTAKDSSMTESNDTIEIFIENTTESASQNNDLNTENIDKRAFSSWLDMLSPTQKTSDKEKTKTPETEKIAESLHIKKLLEVEDNFQFEGQQYILDEGEFNEPLKNYIQEQIETKNTKINPEETYKPKSIDTIDFEEIISETLAKLYLKQGHKEKGIRMYEKLILKFPEKSVYFASEIEKLK